MISWIVQNIGNIAVVLILVLAVTLIIRGLVKDRKQGKSPCGCDCGKCGKCGGK